MEGVALVGLPLQRPGPAAWRSFTVSLHERRALQEPSHHRPHLYRPTHHADHTWPRGLQSTWASPTQSTHLACRAPADGSESSPGWPASPLHHHPPPQGAQHVPGGDITTCCCSEHLVPGHDWAGRPMLALCVSATRGGLLLPCRPSPRVVGQVAKRQRPSFT